MSFNEPAFGQDLRPGHVCGRCGEPLPIMGGMRRCPAPPRDRNDGNICYKKPEVRP